jgi:hypothetical protein
MKIFRITSKELEVKSNIYDFDNGKLRVRKGRKGSLIKKYNPDYWLIRFKDGKTFSVFSLLFDRDFNSDHDFESGDNVVAIKDIYDMVGDSIFVKKGEEGVIEDCRGKDFIRVGFPCHNKGKPIGVHISEIELV